MIVLPRRVVLVGIGAALIALIVLGTVALIPAREPQVGVESSSSQIGPPPIPTRIPLTLTSLPQTATPAQTPLEGWPSATLPILLPGETIPPPTSSPVDSLATQTFVPASIMEAVDDFLMATPLPPHSLLIHQGRGAGSTPEIELATGVYRVFFRTASPTSLVTPVVLDGVCSTFPLFTMSQPVDGSATYRSTGCRVRFDVGNVDGDWELSIETATLRGLLSVPVFLSGTGPATSDLIDLPGGDYHLDLVTNSPYSMVVPIVISGPCLERPIFLLDSTGAFQAMYHSTGCQILFQIDAISTWSLSITLSG